MLYDITLRMSYVYDVPASGSHHILRLVPMNLGERQRLVAGSIRVDPDPDEVTGFTDFFRHPATYLQLRGAHEQLDIRMQARVAVTAAQDSADFSPMLDRLDGELTAHRALDGSSPHHFLGPSPRLAEVPEIAAYGRERLAAGQTVRQVAEALCKRIHEDFTYDGEATSVDTTPAQAFQLKRGVCQDFSHVMILALRSLGIPAGYVSGFLRTLPPPGKERLEGADAMHAWVRVWCGRATGWIELDPTNDIPAGADHVVVAYGRDYSDVAPVIGVLKSYGSHDIIQAVDVVPAG
ncbi:transglutaminase family protein [Rhizobium halophytocola]|uniref:Transglutaminase-like putative cysteine protease n=1 Tax=Rhizobium halophytocola TaxID=735519 RepID=A0ABS4DTC5_9HYPH|nr:transglutaminase family protein [Rhizobium halophytocola]MBP1848951.1 transglutaminase-like putative cysteine protease [Rhizobium halophytocola]